MSWSGLRITGLALVPAFEWMISVTYWCVVGPPPCYGRSDWTCKPYRILWTLSQPVCFAMMWCHCATVWGTLYFNQSQPLPVIDKRCQRECHTEIIQSLIEVWTSHVLTILLESLIYKTLEIISLPSHCHILLLCYFILDLLLIFELLD